MITYGHEKTIEQAILGVLAQDCDFTFELLVANDCSPDATDAIIQSLLATHPKAACVRYICHAENRGMMPNFISTLTQCNGRYIALCDGDDYWTDVHKLQKQVAYLSQNPTAVLCFHDVAILKPDGTLTNDFITKVPASYETLTDFAQKGSYIHTPSVVFRNCLTTYPPEMVQSPIGDFFLYMMLGTHGTFYRIPETMAVYRYGVGVFSGTSSIKMIRSSLQLYTCLLSYLEDDSLKKIIFERQLDAVQCLEEAIRMDYSTAFVSRNWFFKTVRYFQLHYKNPSKIVTKLFSKFKK